MNRFRKWFNGIVRAAKVWLGLEDPDLDNETYPQRALPGNPIIEDHQARVRARHQGQTGQEIVHVPRESTVIKPFDALAKNDSLTSNFTMRRLAAGLVAIMVLGLAAGCVSALVQSKDASNGGKPSVETSSTPTPVTWKMIESGDYARNRWFAEGVEAINTAKTPEQARESANTWLEGVKVDRVLLASASELMLHKKVDPATLADQESMATTQAVGIYLELKDLLVMSEIVPDQAPVSGWNTGINEGSLVRASDAGITGNRNAIRITTPSGEVFWILGRCGNIVTPGQPGLPSGKTDEDEEKNASDDPAAQGNAPEGGGRNADSGPGGYIPPSQMTRPSSAARTDPPPPQVATRPVDSIPDPTPPPAPEVGAPAPSDPVTGTARPPGK